MFLQFVAIVHLRNQLILQLIIFYINQIFEFFMFKTLVLVVFSVFLSCQTLANSLLIKAGDQQWQFTADQLLNISSKQILTSTSWTEGEQTFTGLPLRDLLSHLQLMQGQLQITAINDYQISAPISELLSYDAFIAIKRNEQLLRIRDKGPFWLVFPWTQRPELKRREIDILSIWQISHIQFLAK